jgi:VWFA-related protein
MFRSRIAFAALLAALPAGNFSDAQQSDKQESSGATRSESRQASQDPVLRLEVRQVPVDVVVLDKSGNPIRDLKSEDFTIKEDNKPQQILSFDYLDGSVPSYVPPKVPALPANTFVNVPTQPERGPLYVLYYDMVNTEPEDQISFRGELLKFIDHAQPGTRIALFVNAFGLHLLQGFTSDREQLRSAILSKGPGPHIPSEFLYGRNYGREDVSSAASNLQYLAEYLGGIPGRKILIWLAGKFPVPYGPVYRPVASDGMRNFSDKNTIKYAFAAMMRAQVAISPVDVKGVVLWEERSPSPAGDAESDFSSFHGHSSASGPPGTTGGGDSGGASGSGLTGGQAQITPETMAFNQGQTTGLSGYSVTSIDQNQEDYIARSTGGTAYYSDDRIGAVLEKAIKTGESYYTLSYAPTNRIDDGSERRIEISVAGGKEKGYRLNYRSLYYAVSDDAIQAMHKADTPQAQFLAAKAADALYAHIEHGAPMIHDLLFSAHLAADGDPKMATEAQMLELDDSPIYAKMRKKKGAKKAHAPIQLQKYVIDYVVIDPHLRTQAARSSKPAMLEFAAAAYDPEGSLLNSSLNEGLISNESPRQGKPKSAFHAIQELNAPLGARWIRLVVRNKLDNRIGTLEIRLPLTPDDAATVASRANE